MANQKISWKIHFIELIVVIIGISVAFAMEGWSDSKKQKKLEVNYLNSIRADLLKDKFDLEMIKDSTNVVLRYVGEVFQYVYQNAPVDSYRYHHATSGYMATYFFPKNGTYTSMINSGDLDLIKNFDLRSSISDLYTVDYRTLGQSDNVIKNLSENIIQPYIIENVKFKMLMNGDGILDDAPLKSNKAINMMGSYYNLLSGRQMAYDGVILKCDSLISLLDQELSLKQ